jgi:hypothetical protein
MATHVREGLLRSGPRKPKKNGPVYMLRDRITVKKGCLEQFAAAAEEFLGAMQRERDWKLIAAGVNITGRLNVVTHIWEIPDADSLPETMHWLADAPKYAEIQEYIEKEEQELMLALRYDPKEPEPEAEP